MSAHLACFSISIDSFLVSSLLWNTLDLTFYFSFTYFSFDFIFIFIFIFFFFSFRTMKKAHDKSHDVML